MPFRSSVLRVSTNPLSNFSLLLSSFLLAILGSFLASAADPLYIAAASDLAPLQSELAQTIGKETGITARFSFGGSGILAQQIENGGPFDLYLSANESFVKNLEAKGKLLGGTVSVYAYGRLGLWSKNGRIHSLQELTSKSVTHLALPNPAHAPYGVAAREMLRKLGLWQTLEPRVVYGENVQQALQFAESGNADACVTAWSLVRDKGAILLPASDHPPIRQAGAVVAASGHRAAATRVLAVLRGPAGRALLARYGFSTP